MARVLVNIGVSVLAATSMGLSAPSVSGEKFDIVDKRQCLTYLPMPPDYDKIYQQFVRIAIEVLDVKAAQVTASARLSDDLGADSLDVVQIMLKTEEQFHIHLRDDEVDGVVSVDDAFRLVLKASGLPSQVCEKPLQHKSASLKRQRGIVKFYNASKGFGFISQSKGGQDLLFGSSELSRFNSNFEQGDRVTFFIKEINGKRFAVDLLRG